MLNSQYHEGMFNIGLSSKHQQKASKSSMSAGVQKQPNIQKQNPDGGAHRQHRDANTIFKGYNASCQQHD